MKTLITTLIAVMLAGCEPSDMTAPGACEWYGVVENHTQYAVRTYRALSREELDYACRNSPIPEGAIKLDCLVPYIDGSVQANWLEGSLWGERHVRCHAEHGVEHTCDYKKRIGEENCCG